MNELLLFLQAFAAGALFALELCRSRDATRC